MTLVPGTTLGPYRIIEQVGKGGMATVYKGYQAALTRYVAVKVLPPHLAEDAGFRERFRAEAVTVSKLRHPNILQIHDFGEDQGLSYLVLEFVDGGTLADQLGKSLPVDYAVRMLLPVAAALDYAHSRDVVHRDLKPSNVLLARDGTPVLSDFGLARMMMGSLPRLTQTGAVVGTPEYMAPEQAGGEEAGPAADRYALAVIAYEMLTGSVPFHAETPLATLFAHAYRPLPLPRSRNPQLSEAIEAVLLKGLAKGPEERFATCAELVRSLEEAGRAPAVVLQAAQVTAPPAPAPAPAPPAPQAAAPEPAAATPAPPPAPAPASAPEAAAQAPLAPPPPTVAAPTPRVAAVPRLPLPGRTLALLGGAVALVVVGAVVGVIVAGGQRQVPGVAQTAIPSPTPTSAILVPPSPRPTPTATPAATPTAAPASPTAVLTGTATVTGSVKWSTSGIAGVDVHLVRDAQTLATVATDASGQFRFTRVPAGEYFVRPQLPSGYASSGTPARRAVAEGSTVEIGTIRLYKALTISDPPAGAEVPSSVTLKWQPFEGARLYRVVVTDLDSKVQVLLRETTDTGMALSDAKLQTGRRYVAVITALQDNFGIALGSRTFSVR